MPSKLAPYPPIQRDTLLALLQVSADFAAAEPWADMADCYIVGLSDAVTHEIRIGCVLGNAGQVYGLNFHRHTSGIRWLHALIAEGDPDLEDAVQMDCLKIEFLPKRELPKRDADLLKTVGFKPAGKGRGWPQFQSTQPGWTPWHINQQEAEQLVMDVPRLTRFCALFRQHPNIYEQHLMAEVPFLPDTMPDRPLELADLEWRPLMVPPQPCLPFQPANGEDLRKLPRARMAFEYCCRILPGSTVLNEGRPGYSRTCLTVDNDQGMVLAHHLALATEPFEQSAGKGLVKGLQQLKCLPKQVLVDNPRLCVVLGSFCASLDIDLKLVRELPYLEEAFQFLGGMMLGPGASEP